MESGGSTSGIGADGGQCLLAAVQEGRVVGTLVAAVVIVRLPPLALLFPLTVKNPNESLKTQDPFVQCCSTGTALPDLTGRTGGCSCRIGTVLLV